MSYRVTHAHRGGAPLGISTLGGLRRAHPPLGKFTLDPDVVSDIVDLTSSVVSTTSSIVTQAQQNKDARRATQQAAKEAAADAKARRKQAAADAATRREIALRKASAPVRSTPAWALPASLALVSVVLAAVLSRRRPRAPMPASPSYLPASPLTPRAR